MESRPQRHLSGTLGLLLLSDSDGSDSGDLDTVSCLSAFEPEAEVAMEVPSPNLGSSYPETPRRLLIARAQSLLSLLREPQLPASLSFKGPLVADPCGGTAAPPQEEEPLPPMRRAAAGLRTRSCGGQVRSEALTAEQPLCTGRTSCPSFSSLSTQSSVGNSSSSNTLWSSRSGGSASADLSTSASSPEFCRTRSLDSPDRSPRISDTSTRCSVETESCISPTRTLLAQGGSSVNGLGSPTTGSIRKLAEFKSPVLAGTVGRAGKPLTRSKSAAGQISCASLGSPQVSSLRVKAKISQEAPASTARRSGRSPRSDAAPGWRSPMGFCSLQPVLRSASACGCSVVTDSAETGGGKHLRQTSPSRDSSAGGSRSCTRKPLPESWARRGLGAAPASPARSEGHRAKVICRCRPRVAGDVSGTHTVRVVDGTTLEALEGGEVLRRFSVDSAFGEEASTSDVFSELSTLVREAIAGANAAVLAYGPTGSGKTHTMYGSARSPGLVPRTLALLLAARGEQQQQVTVSMVEVHNEIIVDLLAPRQQPAQGAAPAPRLRGGSADAMPVLEGARVVPGASLESLLALLHAGLSRRHTAATMCNTASSRSHLIVTFGVGTARLTLMDLAGTERVKRSGAEGAVLREAQSINRSLQGLGDVIDGLRRGSHVPFRASPLARLVAGALGGPAAVVVCVPPVAASREELLGALCFAERVGLIPGVPLSN
mmetsp:Transcript_1286/g.3133  ORF Transcript_1286/g.3133 Transcript_1286/m.3133 type:complete len:715 (-) Transcript_1286:330-2474(-)